MKMSRVSVLAVVIFSCALVASAVLTRSSSGQESADLLMFGIYEPEVGPCHAPLTHQGTEKLLLDITFESRRPEYVDAALSDPRSSRVELESVFVMETLEAIRRTPNVD